MPARVVIAGVQSGVGKTTVATGLMAALTDKGYRVQGFKVGPDYIDPGYHTAATGNVSRNLDGWMLPAPVIKEVFARAAAGADISVIEGVMGLFDGREKGGGGASTARVAGLLRAPVVLVVDARGMAESAAALVLGYRCFDPGIALAGVIFNNVGSERHFRMLKKAVEEGAGVKALGYLPKNPALKMPERHLGLVPAPEKEELGPALARLSRAVAETVDLEGVVAVARSAPPLDLPAPAVPLAKGEKKVRLAVAKDAAFNFYYQDALDLLAACGAELVIFSPLSDGALPPGVHGVYIGGGFPEVFLEPLAGNEGMKEDLRRVFRLGMPIYAECGGLMYLCEEIEDFAGSRHRMVGLVPAKARMQNRLAALGYVQARVLADNILAPKGEVVRGHVFHWSVLTGFSAPAAPAYALATPAGEHRGEDGFVRGNLLASYLHLHFAGRPALARNFVESCRRFRETTVPAEEEVFPCFPR